MVVRDQVAWAASAVVGPPFFDSTRLREFLGATASGLGVVIGVGLVAGAVWLAVKTKHDTLRVLAIHAGCLFVFYALYLPATWFFRRYLVPVHLLTAVLAASYVRQRAAAIWFAVAAVQIGGFFVARPAMTVDQGHNGAKGYAVPAQEILELAPEGAVIGAFQTGALGYFADGSGRTVVNLDGVVDAEAAAALRAHDLEAFVSRRGVTHFADWPMNARRFRACLGGGHLKLRAIAVAAEPQGKGERFTLYELVW